MSTPVNQEGVDWLDYFVRFAGEIFVREQVDGKWGSYSLAELPGSLAFAHAKRLAERKVVVIVRSGAP